MATFDITEEYKKNPELQEDDVKTIREWVEKQPHLPKVSDEQIVLFLHSCFYKLEATKNCIEHYFKIRTNASELFANRSLDYGGVREALDTMMYAKLPGKTPDGYEVFFSALNRTDVKYFNSAEILKSYNMQGDICFKENGTVDGTIYVIDMNGTSLSHITRLSLTALKNHFKYVQEGFPVRLKQIHIINVAPFIDIFMRMIKPLTSAELFQKIQQHTPDSEEIYKYIPKTMFPKEYGGDSPSLKELHEITLKKFEENKKWFKEEQNQRIDKTKLSRKTPADEIESIQGSFKSFSID